LSIYQHINCFQENLKELMEINSLTVSDLEKKTGVNHTGIYDYLDGKYIPDIDCATKIAGCFNCSFDYLFGFTESYFPCEYSSDGDIKSRVKTAIDKSGFSRYKVAQLTNTSQNQVCNWYHGKVIPKLISLVALATVLHCSLDYLAGRDEI
jgi:transcriptional regulator with XRE-family HTH domain